MNKLIVATMMLAMGTAAFGAEQNQVQADPLVSALNNLLDNLSGNDAQAKSAIALDGNSAAAKAGRSKKDTAVAIGTAAAIGSAIGAMIAKDDRAKGAAIGAAVGGIAGLIYDRMHAKDEAAKSTDAPAPPQIEEAQTPNPIEKPLEKKIL